MAEDEVGEVGKDQIIQGIIGHCRKLGSEMEFSLRDIY